MNWKNIAVASAAPVEAARPALKPSITDLEDAAKRWDARSDSFAQGKNQICRDMAAKLRRFGSYASEAQRGFAEKLVAWSLPRPVVTPQALVTGYGASPAQATAIAAAVSNEMPMPDTFAVMQKHSKFLVGDLTIQRQNQNTICWIKVKGFERVVGKIDNGVATLFTPRFYGKPERLQWVREILAEIEANPLGTAMKYGKLSGRCCMCGRDLTDPVSIERGIGPICEGGF
jgi:hypothetical protein